VAARAIAGAGPDERGYHPPTRPTPVGSRLGLRRILVHAWDVGRAFEVNVAPPDDLADRIRRRLFPGLAEGGEPWPALRWCTGRVALPGLPAATPGRA
jgi:hypothetical protein